MIPLYRERRWILASLAVAALTFAVYLPALFNGFVNWDDDIYVTMNPHLRAVDAAFPLWAFTSLYAGNWHPLTWMSHASDVLLWGLNPFGHHLTSVLLHVLNTLILMALARVLHGCAASKGISETAAQSALRDREGFAVAVCTGILFGIHPVHVESVAWVAERKDLLCAFFYLLSCLAYIRYAQESRAADGGSWLGNGKYLLSVTLFLAAAMSKAMAVSLPVVLLILDWYPLGRVTKGRLVRITAEKIPFAVIAADVSLTAIAGQTSGMSVASLEEISLPSRIALCAESLVRYLGMIVYPADLSPFYPLPRDMDFASPGALAAYVFVILCTLIGILAAGRRRIWLAAWLCFAVTLLPVLGLMKIGSQAVADRYLYLPGIALIVTAAFGISSAVTTVSHLKSGPLRTAFLAVGAAGMIALTLVLSSSTITQIGVWKDSESLWRRAISVIAIKGSEHYRNAFHVYYHLGTAYADMNRHDEAAEAFRDVLRLNPRFSLAHHALGVLHYREGRYDDAAAELHSALKLDPYSVKALNLLGMAYLAQLRTEDAIREFRTALMINPEFYLSHLNLGIALLRSGMPDEAAAHLQKAHDARPDLPDVRESLAAAHAMRDGSEAHAAGLRLP